MVIQRRRIAPEIGGKYIGSFFTLGLSTASFNGGFVNGDFLNLIALFHLVADAIFQSLDRVNRWFDAFKNFDRGFHLFDFFLFESFFNFGSSGSDLEFVSAIY